MYNHDIDFSFNDYAFNDIFSEQSFCDSLKSGYPYYNVEPNNLFNNDDKLDENNNVHLFIAKENKLNQNIDNNQLRKDKENKEKSFEKNDLSEVYKSKLKTTKFTDTIFQISKESKIIKKGRKKNGNIAGKHNKFSTDNIIRKIKVKLLSSIGFYINSKLKESCLQNNLKSLLFLTKPEQKYIRDTSCGFNLKLLNTKIKDIFSDVISKKNLILGKDYNKNMVNKIYKEENYKNIADLLEMTLSDYVNHINGIKYEDKLKGLEVEFKNIVNNMNETHEYIENFYLLFNRFEFHFKKKKPRKKKVIS